MTARRTDMHKLQELVHLHRQGRSARDIARLLQMSRNTVRSYVIALTSANVLDGAPADLPELAVIKAALPARPPPQEVSTVADWLPRVRPLVGTGAGPSAIFVTAKRLFAELRSGRGDGTYERRLARYCDVAVLIIDDLGLMPLRGDEPADLYEIIRLRYERRSMVITSNRSAAKWPGVFGDPLLASAAVDRLRHHAHIIEIEGPSYRDPKARQAAAA